MRETGTGLVLAEQAGDEAGLSHALKQIDRRLVLQKHPAAVAGGFVYKVFVVVSEDQPAECICTWADEHGNPLQLSSGLLDLVQSLDPSARDRRGPTAEQRNGQLRTELANAREQDADRVSEDHRGKVERATVTVGMSTRPAKPYWQRNSHLPERFRR